jgi:hypothetical protein
MKKIYGAYFKEELKKIFDGREADTDVNNPSTIDDLTNPGSQDYLTNASVQEAIDLEFF